MLPTVIIILVLFFLIGGGILQYFKSSANKVLKFIQANPNKLAIKCIRNGTVLVEKNPNQMMPLASTMKIIIAIEYAEQAANDQINPNEIVSNEQLECFFIKNSDGGAHQQWLNSLTPNHPITIHEVAKGMMIYSSNAGTEWLMARLGLRKINKRLQRLGLKNHTPIYYLVSSLFIGKEKFPTLKGMSLARKLKALSDKDYAAATLPIHQKLLNESSYKQKEGDLSMPVQKAWSNKLPSSTVNTYTELMQKINSKNYFSPKVHYYLDELLESLMNTPANQKWLKHSGIKGGSTPFVLTQALYATDKEDNTTELVYFFNDLNLLENMRLEKSLNDFNLNILKNQAFRDKLNLITQAKG